MPIRRSNRASADRSRRKRAILWSAAAVAAAVAFYATLGLVVASACIGTRARWRGMTGGPQDFGLASETISFRSLDGVPLRAWWMRAAPPARGSVVLAHGIDHTRQVMLPRAAFLVRAGYNVLALDLRDHGESGGTVISPGYLEANDVLAGIQYVRQREAHLPVAVLGVSLGAAAGIFASARSRDIDALIADGAFPTGGVVYRNIVGHVMRDRGSAWWLRLACALANAPGAVPAISWAYYVRTGVNLGPQFGSPVSAAARVRVPVLLISGSDDWIVLPSDARLLQAGFTGVAARLVTIPHATHDNTYSTAPELYEAAVLEFLRHVDRAHERAAHTAAGAPALS